MSLMNIVSLNSYDLGGLSYNLCDAINKLTSHYAVQISVGRVYTDKPVMFIRDELENAKIRSLIKNADVLHFNQYTHLIERYNINSAECRNKKILYHGHGGAFRRDPGKIKRFYRRLFPKVKIMASTPDLLKQGEGEWFPSIMPIVEQRRTYKMRRNDVPIVYYSPTKPPEHWNWDLNTLEAVANELRGEGLELHVHFRRKITHGLNLELKSKADIYFDELKIFYGINALEAAVFEMNVIHGLSPFCRDYMKNNKVKCPFTSVPSGNRGIFKNELRKLISDKKYRIRVGKKAFKYVSKMHNPRTCVRRFLALVE